MAIRRQNTRSERMDSLDPYASSTRKKSGLCYAFKEGFCAHGDNCQFRHEEKEKDLDENGDEIIYLESSRLYVNNLAWNVTWQDLKGMFRKEGTVTRVEVLNHPDGRSKGCGIVEYSDIDAAARALTTLNGVELRGRAVYVREDRESSKGMKGNGSKGGGSGGGGVVTGDANKKKGGKAFQGTSSTTTQNKNPAEEIIYLETPRLYVNNLSFNVTWQDLKGLFRQEGAVARCEIMTHPDGRSKGCGIVQYMDINAAARALVSINGMELRGRAVYVREDRDTKSKSSRGAHKGGKREQQGGNSNGETVVVLDSPRLFVNNLPYDVSWQDVKDLFRQEGEVRRTNVITGADGRSLGCAIVEFMDMEGAARAVRALHDVEYRGRTLQVREDRENKYVFKS